MTRLLNVSEISHDRRN